jgi:hypothetical protein
VGIRGQKKAAGRSAALRAALGIGRLDPLISSRTPLSEGIAAYGRLDQTARRQLAKIALMVGAAILGFWGFQITSEANVRWQTSTIWSNAFRTLQLLTTQFPPNLPTELPIQLQIARFALPVFAIWFTIAAVMRRFNRPLMAWYAGFRRNHIVLFGDTPVTRAFTRAFRAVERDVVAIIPPVESDKVAPIEVNGARVAFGDPTRPLVLRRAGLHRAAAAIAADDVGKSAVALAAAVAAVSREKRSSSAPPLTFLLRLSQRELRALVATQIAAAMRESHVDVRLYIRERTVARSLLARYPLDWGLPPGPHDIHAAIVGLGDMGAELLLQLARIAVPVPGRRAILTAIDTRADGLRDQLLAEHPGLANCGELRFVNAEVHPSAIKASEVDDWFQAPIPATAIYVCCGDDHTNLSMAIGLRRAYARLGQPSPPVFVYQRDSREPVEALPHIHATAIDTLRILPFGDVAEEADPFYLIDEEIDDLARLMHEEYLRSRDSISSAEGATPAQKPWSELPEIYRTANRSQADHISSKLRALGWHASTSIEDAPPPIAPADLELLARQEHERWSRDRWLGGWTYGAKRDDAERHHPNLLPYEQLSEALQGLDRKTVTSLPALLADLGIGLRRDLRLGVWFGRAAVPPAVVVQIAERAARLAGKQHIQLVLPLQSSAEFQLAQSVARTGAAGVDVALARNAARPAGEIGADADLLGVRRLIAASDRTFSLALDETLELEAAVLGALCDASDRVLIGCVRAATGQALAQRLDATRRAKIEIVSLHP